MTMRLIILISFAVTLLFIRNAPPIPEVVA